MTEQELKNGKELSGIITFISDHCKICLKQKELFDKVSLKYDTIVCDNDPNYFISEHNIDTLPETRIYESGKVVWSKIDFVSEEDLEFLRRYI
jgi:glutaredoxin